MSKLLFVFERDMPTISITRDVFTHLTGYPQIVSDFMYLTDVKPSDIDSHDVIIFIRPNNTYSWKIAAQARKAGHVVISMCDDDLLNLPKGLPTIPWRKKGLVKMLANSDAVWSPSPYILDKYRELTAGKRTVLSDTIIRPEELEGVDSDTDTDKVRIVYAAAASHAELFETYVGPVVPRLAQQFGDKIEFTFISVHPKLDGVKCNYLPGMPLLEFRKYMKEQKFDIGLAPLHRDEFSKCKYYNKFLEYTTQGVVGVYSKTEPYTYVVRDGENGFLADSSADSWYEALHKAIGDRVLRNACLANAVEYLADHHSETACMERMRQSVPEIFDEQGSYDFCRGFSVQKIKYYLRRPMDKCYLLFFYLKNTGINGVVNKTKRHFVEAKAYRRPR